MSYDLFFYKKKNDPITKNDIESYLNNQPNLKENIGRQWFFYNKDTGVYWTFEYYANDEVEDGFEDFEDTNFTFNINFVRPNFFGNETFPIVENFTRHLNLFILNPQGDAVPKIYDNRALEKDWLDTNERFARNYFDEWNLNYLENDKSDYAWKYCLEKTKLQNHYGEGYFVPNIFYVKKHNSRLVETLCVWPEHISCILPKVDLILINKKINRLFWKKNEEGLIRYVELIDQLGDHFAREEDYIILHPENAEKISKSFNRLKLFNTLEEYGECISVEKFVNIKPDENIEI